MHFGALNNLVWLWLVLGLGVFLVWAKKRRQRTMERFTQEHLLKEIASSLDPKRINQKNI